jgi:hypothetical protein
MEIGSSEAGDHPFIPAKSSKGPDLCPASQTWVTTVAPWPVFYSHRWRWGDAIGGDICK